MPEAAADMPNAPQTTSLRAGTLNVFGRRENWEDRRHVLRSGLRALRPDLMALQEVIADEDYDQARDLFGDDYHIVHHSVRERDGEGVTIASRWPIVSTHELDSKITSRAVWSEGTSLIVEVEAPDPIGTVLFVNHVPSWQLTYEYERERQTVLAARKIEELVEARPTHVVLAGDLDATPDAASIRFLKGLQSLDGMSVMYRDAWDSVHPDDAGHTFSPENALVPVGDDYLCELELGRRIDYVLVRSTFHVPTLHVLNCERIFDKAVDGVWGSDHFGVLTDLSPFAPSGRLISWRGLG